MLRLRHDRELLEAWRRRRIGIGRAMTARQPEDGECDQQACGAGRRDSGCRECRQGRCVTRRRGGNVGGAHKASNEWMLINRPRQDQSRRPFIPAAGNKSSAPSVLPPWPHFLLPQRQLTSVLRRGFCTAVCCSPAFCTRV